MEVFFNFLNTLLQHLTGYIFEIMSSSSEHPVITDENLQSHSGTLLPLSINASAYLNILRLKEYLTQEDLKELKDNCHTEIHISGEDETSFYKDDVPNDALRISPTVINPNVKNLTLYVCRLHDENLKDIHGFQHLEILNVRTNIIGDEGLKSIALLRNLTTLNIANNKIGDEGIRVLVLENTHLVNLNVSLNTNVTDEGAELLKKVTTLKKLEIEFNSISRAKYQEMQREGLEITYYPLPDLNFRFF